VCRPFRPEEAGPSVAIVGPRGRREKRVHRLAAGGYGGQVATREGWLLGGAYGPKGGGWRCEKRCGLARTAGAAGGLGCREEEAGAANSRRFGYLPASAARVRPCPAEGVGHEKTKHRQTKSNQTNRIVQSTVISIFRLIPFFSISVIIDSQPARK
jgi:hypothetical protein